MAARQLSLGRLRSESPKSSPLHLHKPALSIYHAGGTLFMFEANLLAWPDGGCRCWDPALCTVAHCILHVRRGPDRTSEGLRRLATVLPSFDPHRPASDYWRCACGVYDGGRFALVVRFRASRTTRGTCQAKEYPENMMVNTLPLKTKDTLCISYLRPFLPVPSISAAARSASSSSSSL